MQLPPAPTAAAAARVIQGAGIALVTQQEPSPCKNYHLLSVCKLWEQFGFPNEALVLFQSFQAVSELPPDPSTAPKGVSVTLRGENGTRCLYLSL